MKKIVKVSILVATGFAGIFLVSCTKKAKSDNKPSGNVSVVGFWSGTFLNGSANESEVFKSDGTTVQYDFYNQTSTDTATCEYKAYGTYSVTGNTLTFSITYPTLGESFKETATINISVSPYVMTGTYSGSGSGNFTMTMQ
jgi:hypothetical protein